MCVTFLCPPTITIINALYLLIKEWLPNLKIHIDNMMIFLRRVGKDQQQSIGKDFDIHIHSSPSVYGRRWYSGADHPLRATVLLQLRMSHPCSYSSANNCAAAKDLLRISCISRNTNSNCVVMFQKSSVIAKLQMQIKHTFFPYFSSIIYWQYEFKNPCSNVNRKKKMLFAKRTCFTSISFLEVHHYITQSITLLDFRMAVVKS